MSYRLNCGPTGEVEAAGSARLRLGVEGAAHQRVVAGALRDLAEVARDIEHVLRAELTPALAELVGLRDEHGARVDERGQIAVRTAARSSPAKCTTSRNPTCSCWSERCRRRSTRARAEATADGLAGLEGLVGRDVEPGQTP